MKKDALIGSLVYYDARVDDARLVVNLVRTAAQFGALAANRTQVVEMLKDGNKVVGAKLRDME
ncbi:FAD-dependent oxidoreductase, partial [Enterococcus faecalis]|nr:FAD-dependent oxidoreductase [Enterococcus faecalis]